MDSPLDRHVAALRRAAVAVAARPGDSAVPPGDARDALCAVLRRVRGAGSDGTAALPAAAAESLAESLTALCRYVPASGGACTGKAGGGGSSEGCSGAQQSSPAVSADGSVLDAVRLAGFLARFHAPHLPHAVQNGLTEAVARFGLHACDCGDQVRG